MKTKHEIFDSLISEELGILRAAAYRLLGDPAEVDEAVQEALITAWNKFDQFQGEAKLSSWIYRITVNQCCDRLRKRQREREKLQAYARSEAAESAGTNHNEQLDLLAEAVADLPELYRDSILIGCLSDHSSEDAAALLGCSVNTLYQRIHKAKQLLKEKLEVMV